MLNSDQFSRRSEQTKMVDKQDEINNDSLSSFLWSFNGWSHRSSALMITMMTAVLRQGLQRNAGLTCKKVNPCVIYALLCPTRLYLPLDAAYDDTFCVSLQLLSHKRLQSSIIFIIKETCIGKDRLYFFMACNLPRRVSYTPTHIFSVARKEEKAQMNKWKNFLVKTQESRTRMKDETKTARMIHDFQIPDTLEQEGWTTCFAKCPLKKRRGKGMKDWKL